MTTNESEPEGDSNSDEESDFPNWDEPFETHLEKVKSRKSKNTLDNRRVSMEQWREYCTSEGTTILDAEPQNLDDWLDHLNNEGYAGKSILNKFYDISAMYKFLWRRRDVDEIGEQWVDEMADTNLDWLSTDAKINEHVDSRYLEIEEYEQLLDECQNLREELVLRLLWETGVRGVEAMRIKESDIDTDERVIEVETAKQGEGNSEDREVFYQGTLGTVLKKWLDRGGRERYLGADESPFLLVTKESPMMHPNVIGDIVRDVAERAGLNDVVTFFDEDEMEMTELTTVDGRPRYRISTHSLRHSYAVHRTKRGMPIIYLKELLGHSDIEQTRIYLQFRDDDLKEAEENYAPKVP